MKMKATIIFLCCGFYFQLVSSDLHQTLCQDGWLAFRGSCYFFGDDNMVFSVAEQFCRNHNSHLIHIDGAVENAFIRTWLHKLPAANWWIGLKDEYIEGIFQWTDTNDAVDYTDWYPGQPLSDGDCVHFHQAFDYHWDDVPCMKSYRPLCEIRVNQYVTVQGIVG